MTRRIAVLLVATVAAVVADTRVREGHVAFADAPGAAVTLPAPAPATALVLGDWSRERVDTLWATQAGGVSVVTPTLAGGAALTGTIALPGVDPVAVAWDFPRTLVLDRAAEAVRVYRGEPDQGLTPQATLAVGSRPSALVVADFNGDQKMDIAVANEGSNDVSMILAGQTATGYLPQQRIGVGAQPRALTTGDYDDRPGLDLGVANFASSSVSILGADDHGSFSRRGDIAVGAGPSAFPAFDEYQRPLDFDGDEREDIVVADAGDGTLSVLLGTNKLPRLASRLSLPGGAASQPVAVAYGWSPAQDYGLDVFVAARGTGEVLAVHATPDGTFGRLKRLFAVAQPIALIAGSFGGDYQEDLAVADAFGTVRVVTTPGARLVVADPHVASIAARDGVLMWSRHAGPHDYRLATTLGGTAHDVAVRPSRRDPLPRIGSRAGGAAVVTRTVCDTRRCAALEWRLGATHERAIHLPAVRGCRLLDVAEWRGNVAYLLRSATQGSCPVPARGLWMRARTGPPRRFSARAYRLGDVRGGWASWFEYVGDGDHWRLRIARLHGRAITAATGNFDCCDLDGGAIDGRYVYWTERSDAVTATLERASLSKTARSDCQYLPPIRGLPHAGFAIDHGRPFYVGHALSEFLFDPDVFGIFEIPASRVRWHTC